MSLRKYRCQNNTCQPLCSAKYRFELKDSVPNNGCPSNTNPDINSKNINTVNLTVGNNNCPGSITLNGTQINSFEEIESNIYNSLTNYFNTQLAGLLKLLQPINDFVPVDDSNLNDMVASLDLTENSVINNQSQINSKKMTALAYKTSLNALAKHVSQTPKLTSAPTLTPVVPPPPPGFINIGFSSIDVITKPTGPAPSALVFFVQYSFSYTFNSNLNFTNIGDDPGNVITITVVSYLMNNTYNSIILQQNAYQIPESTDLADGFFAINITDNLPPNVQSILIGSQNNLQVPVYSVFIYTDNPNIILDQNSSPLSPSVVSNISPNMIGSTSIYPGTTSVSYNNIIIDSFNPFCQGSNPSQYTIGVSGQPKNIMVGGQSIYKCSALQSLNDTYLFAMQGNGNLVLYNTVSGTIIYSSGTAQITPSTTDEYRLLLSDFDATLQIIKNNTTLIFKTTPYYPLPPNYKSTLLRVQDNGYATVRIVLTNDTEIIVWQTS